MAHARSTHTGMWVVMTASAGLISWQAAAMTLAATVICETLRLLTAWQRRQAIEVLMTRAPEGTVVVLSGSPAGQSMRASLGRRAAQRSDSRS
jgi:hypothetical protein